jgi:hypothetical protein
LLYFFLSFQGRGKEQGDEEAKVEKLKKRESITALLEILSSGANR